MSIWENLRSVVRFRGIELNAAARRLERAADVRDLRRQAHRRLPGGVFDYIDGAAEDELSLRRSIEAFRQLEFRPNVLNDVGEVNTRVSVLGREVAFPLVLSPTGFSRIADPEGELAVARAAERAGIPYTLSTLSTRSIEEVAAASDGDLWFQVYVWRDRGLVADMLDRARRSGYRVIVITVDTAVLGRRERDVRRGFSLPPKIGAETLLDGLLHPGWTWAFLRSDPIKFANVVGRSSADGSDPVSLSDYINSQFDPSLSWSDIGWFRDRWDGPILLKGIQTVADARTGADVGIDGIALSNHGGRQLDGSPAPLELVPDVVDAVGGRVDILCDGGVRRGSDVVKAVALGATACMAGRAYLYGLGAAGEAGVDHVLEHLHAGVARTMALAGRSSVHDLGPDLVQWRQTRP